ncbi:ABC transporter permease [Lactovum miscens]|uniref:Oligopeptide transport system permease protein n=1 Tax=Lactovum miscens TaxID=190387 RepID=A0A841C5B3_9LACT|nr:ABC transporter permease [Lactovum miscens]MBB5887457.1 oligopeptide transport system permease protein [Lactovum miscens]
MENIERKFVLVGEKGSDSNEHISKPALSFLQDAWRRLRLNKVAVVSMIFLILVLLFSIGSSFVVTQNKANNFDSNKTTVYGNLPPKLGNIGIPGWNGVFQQPGASSAIDMYKDQGVPKKTTYIAGTDQFGRSMALRVIYGLRVSLIVAFAAAFLDLVIGVAYGLISGWFGGRVDMVMQRIIEIISCIPDLVIVTMLALLLGQGILPIILAMALFSWTGMARQVRSQVLTFKSRDFVLAAQTLGESTFKIMIKHLVPNISGIIIVNVMMSIPSKIMYEAILSAIGLGIKAPTASLGTLINDALPNLQFYPWQLAIPAVVLSLLSLAFILFGDGLRDAFDPRASED